MATTGYSFTNLKTVCRGLLFVFFVADGLAQTEPSSDSEWSLLAADGSMYHFDGMNSRYCPTDCMILYDGDWLRAHRLEVPLCLVVDQGIAGKMETLRDTSGVPDTAYGIAAQWDARAWLEKHVRPGDKVRVVPTPPFPEFQISFPLDKIDQELTGPGLACFTSDFGRVTPPSNYRIEAVVKDGRVCSLGGGENQIPASGFVLSGHGTGQTPAGSTRILRWCGIGCRVEIDVANHSVAVTTDRKAWLLRAEDKVNKAAGFVARNAKKIAPADVASANTYLADSRSALARAKERLKVNDPARAWIAVRRCLDLSERAMCSASRTVSADTIRAVCSEALTAHRIMLIKNAGFNAVILLYETSAAKNYDALERSVQMCHQAGLSVYLWTMLPHHFPLPDKISDKFARDVQRNGQPTDSVDISLPEARKAVAEEVRSVCQRLKAEGVLFDYEYFFGGYSKSSIRMFCEANGLNPATFDPTGQASKEISQQWELWRQNLIRDLLYACADAAHEAGTKVDLCFYPSLECGTAETPGPDVWGEWMRGEKFDSLSPMFYTQSPRWLEKTLTSFEEKVRSVNAKVKINPILIYWPEICGWCYPIPTDWLLEQTDIVAGHPVQGLSFFSAGLLESTLHPEFGRLWRATRSGPYRNVVPK